MSNLESDSRSLEYSSGEHQSILPLADGQESTPQTTSITCNYQRSHQFRTQGASAATSVLPRQWFTTTTSTLGQPRRLPCSHARGSPQGIRSYPAELGTRRRHSPPFSLDPTTQDPPRYTYQHDRLVTAQLHTPYNPEVGTHYGHTQTRKTRLLGTQSLPNDISLADTIKND